MRGQLARAIPQPGIDYGLFYKGVSFVPRRDGLVFQVVNDDYYGGAGVRDGFAVSIGQGTQFHTVSHGDILDHDSSQSTANLNLDAITAVFALA